jgi:arsenite-transporting ATPase
VRIILFTGKGGVGKTSIAAATALRSAQLGYKTIVMSTDAAHSLGDSFDIPVGSKPVKITNNLDAQEIDVYAELNANWGQIQEFIKDFLSRRGFDNLVAEELAIFPGMEELFSLVRIKNYYEKESYDVVIVDCAPTGGTIQMLSFPDIAKWYIRKIFPIQRNVARVARPVAKSVANIQLPTDEVFASIKKLYTTIEGMREILTNKRQASIRLVLNPEKMVIKEAQRAYTYLNLFDFLVDAIIVNRVLPEEVNDSYFDRWQLVQQTHLQEIKTSFEPLPILKVKLFEEEVIGIEGLSQMADELYKDSDPIKLLYKDKPIKITQRNGNYLLSIKLPFVSKKNLNMWVHGEELIIKADNYKRNVVLPRTLAKLNLEEAKFEKEKLLINFKKEGVRNG